MSLDHDQRRLRVLQVGGELFEETAVRTPLEDIAGAATVFTATSAAEAVDIAGREDLTAVIAQYDLPDGDGLSVLRRCLASDDSLLTILVASEGSEALMDRAYEAGVDEFVHYASPAKDRLIEHYLETYLGSDAGNGQRPRTSRHMESLAATATDVIVSIDTESTIQYVNPAVEDVFGYEPEDVLGESLTVLMPDELTADHERGIARYLATGERTLDWDDVELPGQHSNGHEIPLSISFAEFTAGSEQYFTGIIRDIRERKRLEAERRLYHTATQEILQADSLESGLEIALEAIGAAMEWEYGEAWVRSDDGIERVPDTYAASESVTQFARETSSVYFEPDTGLVGRVWADADPEWVPDVTAADAPFERTDAARAAGLRAALGVPVVSEGTVVAVLVFFLSDARDPDEQLMEQTTTVATDLSRLMNRLQTEAALRDERNLKDRILETTSVGLLIVAADGTVRYLNDRAADILDLGDCEGPLTVDSLDIEWRTFDGEPLHDGMDLYRRVVDTDGAVAGEGRVQVDGEARWLSLHGAPLRDETAAGTTAVLSVQDITPRKERERQLKQYEAVMQTVSDGVYALDDDGRFIVVNDAYTKLTGYNRDELLGAQASDFFDTELIDRANELQTEIEEDGRETATLEAALTTASNETVPIEVRLSLYERDGDAYGRVGVVRDITERMRREERLAGLNEVGQSLTEAETPEEVADIVVDGAGTILDLPLTTVEYYDETAGKLQPGTRSQELESLVGLDPVFASEWDLPWQVYAEKEKQVYGNLAAETDLEPDETPLESAVLVPIGDHGVFIAGATVPDSFTETDVLVAEILVENIVAALDRVEREQQLRGKKERIESHNESLERVNRLNRVIRGLTRKLTEASTREEIEQAVCAELAASEPYVFAWIGQQRVASDTVVVRASAGREDGYLDAVGSFDESPWNRSDTGDKLVEPTVRNNLQADPPFEPWRSAAIRCGYRAAIAVPLVYGNTVYGILTLFAEAPDTFDEVEEAVLGEMGEMIGYAINALEHRQALVSEGAVELRFRIRDSSIPAIELATETGGHFEFETFIEVDADQLRVFFTGTGAEPDSVYQAVDQLPSFKRVSLLSDRDGTYRYEALVSGSGFFATLFEHGIHPRAMLTDADEGELTVELPQSSDTQSVISMFRDSYENVELLGRKEHDRPVLTRAEFEATYKDRLTERQQEVLQMAYFSGFFQWPRDISATELAELLGISQPTVSRHIRSGQREMFSLVFDNWDQS